MTLEIISDYNDKNRGADVAVIEYDLNANFNHRDRGCARQWVLKLNQLLLNRPLVEKRICGTGSWRNRHVSCEVLYRAMPTSSSLFLLHNRTLYIISKKQTWLYYTMQIDDFCKEIRTPCNYKTKKLFPYKRRLPQFLNFVLCSLFNLLLYYSFIVSRIRIINYYVCMYVYTYSICILFWSIMLCNLF